ncbi:MAG TPA: amidohydrolase family protein [Mycobacteriales bacterium]|nr:amidohydrolase family protein [Mycobacteriales bacterium]
MSDTWYVGATVVDGTGADPVETDVHVVDGKVAALGKAPSGADTVDLSGLTVTPGLIDGHVHLGLSSPIRAMLSHQISAAEIAADIFNTARQMVQAGFTTVRDCGGIDGGVPAAINKGTTPGPRVIQCGPIQCQTGGHGHFANEWEATSLWETHHIPGLCGMARISDGPETMRRNIRETFRGGADFIKMCVSGGVISSHDKISDTQFTVEEIAVAVQEASARGTYVTVHSHNNDGIRNAVAGGVKCIEHACALDEETAQLMLANDVSHVPTLLTVKRLVEDAVATGVEPEIRDRALVVQQGQINGVLVSRKVGVRMGLGSDLLGPDQHHRGEELFLRSELTTPMETLVSATKVNSQILRISDQVGTLEVGKVADLVAWNGNPLESPKLWMEPDNAAVVVQSGRVAKDLR